MAPTYTATEFKRDLVPGDVGDDVKKMQDILNFFGYPVDENEASQKRFGPSTQSAAQRWRDELAQNKNPFAQLFANILLQILFQTSLEDLDFDGGKTKPIRQYRDGNEAELQVLEAGTWGKAGTSSRAVCLASQFIGQREQGDNGGALVRKLCDGKEGLPWCGGFVNYVMDHAISPKLFDQQDCLSARSYEREGQKYGAFHAKNTYVPKPGDVLVFERGQGKGHVGIVSEVAADGTVTYVAGNDGNAVRARTFDVNHPPKSLIGYTDVHALAAAKGIALQPDAPGLAKPSMAATQHSDKSFIRG